MTDCSAPTATAIDAAFSRLLARFAREKGLSTKQLDILALAASRGLAIKQIAGAIDRSPKAVQQAWSRIYAKTGCGSQLEVMAGLLRAALARGGEDDP